MNLGHFHKFRKVNVILWEANVKKNETAVDFAIF